MAVINFIPDVFNSREELIARTREDLMEEVRLYEDNEDILGYEMIMHYVHLLDTTAPEEIKVRFTNNYDVEICIAENRLAFYYREQSIMNFHIEQEQVSTQGLDTEGDWADFDADFDEDDIIF